MIFSNLNSNCSNSLDIRNLQEQIKKAFSYQKLFWPSTVWINCSSDPKNLTNSRPSASNFNSFSRSLEQFFLTVGQNNFSNKIPFLSCSPGPAFFSSLLPSYSASPIISTFVHEWPIRTRRTHTARTFIGEKFSGVFGK